MKEKKVINLCGLCGKTKDPAAIKILEEAGIQLVFIPCKECIKDFEKIYLNGKKQC